MISIHKGIGESIMSPKLYSAQPTLVNSLFVISYNFFTKKHTK